jgi:hypothetical protein
MASFRGFENVGQGLAGAADILAQGYKDRLELQRQAQAQQVQAQYHQQQIANEQQKLAQQYGRQEIPASYLPLAIAGAGALQGQRLPASSEITPEMIAKSGIQTEGDKYYAPSKSAFDLLEKTAGGMAAQQTAGIRNIPAQQNADLKQKQLDLQTQALMATLYKNLKPDQLTALTNPEAGAAVQQGMLDLIAKISGSAKPTQPSGNRKAYSASKKKTYILDAQGNTIGVEDGDTR